MTDYSLACRKSHEDASKLSSNGRRCNTIHGGEGGRGYIASARQSCASLRDGCGAGPRPASVSSQKSGIKRDNYNRRGRVAVCSRDERRRPMASWKTVSLDDPVPWKGRKRSIKMMKIGEEQEGKQRRKDGKNGDEKR